MINILKTFALGKGTYIVSAATVVHSLLGYFIGNADVATATLEIIAALGLATTRRAIG